MPGNVLFLKRFHEGILDGAVTITFRRWARPMVKPGGRYRCHPIGVLEVVAADTLAPADLTDAQARQAGFAGRQELLDYLTEHGARPFAKGERLHRIDFRHAGDDDARPGAFESTLTDDERKEISSRLDRLDRSSPVGPWTRGVLALVSAHPRKRAADLAQLVGRSRLDFKKDVRKLKAFGLTISHEVGYELSPRGRRFLEMEAAARAGKDILYRELEPDDWPRLERLFGPRGACGGCWCMWWRVERGGRLWDETRGDRARGLFRRLVRQGRALGVLALDGDRPVGWCSFGPRADFPRLETVKSYRRDDAHAVWCVNCFFIPREFRRRGIARGLLQAALNAMRQRAVATVEAYPVTTTADGRMVTDAFAFTGPLALFQSEGFREVQRLAPTRPLVRLELGPQRAEIGATRLNPISR